MEKTVRILVVEDEYMIAEDITYRLQEFGYEISGQADNAEDAIKILKEGDTDLALLDVNIRGRTDGIELARFINENFKLPFIFLTSLASRSVVERATETKPAAYLLKPFNDRQVQIAINLALVNYAKNETAMEINPEFNLKNEENSMISMNDSLFLRKDNSFTRVKFTDIDYLTAEGNYTLIFTKNGKFVYSNVLKNFEKKLPKKIFLRVHRSFLLNVNAITGFEGNYVHINQKKIPVSKKFRDQIFKIFKTI